MGFHGNQSQVRPFSASVTASLVFPQEPESPLTRMWPSGPLKRPLELLSYFVGWQLIVLFGFVNSGEQKSKMSRCLSLSSIFQCSIKRDGWRLLLLRKKMQSPYSCNIYETYISFPLQREGVGAYLSTGVGGQWCGSRHPSLVVCGCQRGRLWCLVIWSNTVSIIQEDSIPSGGLSRGKAVISWEGQCSASRLPLDQGYLGVWWDLQFTSLPHSSELPGTIAVWLTQYSFFFRLLLIPPLSFRHSPPYSHYSFVLHIAWLDRFRTFKSVTQGPS